MEYNVKHDREQNYNHLQRVSVSIFNAYTLCFRMFVAFPANAAAVDYVTWRMKRYRNGILFCMRHLGLV